MQCSASPVSRGGGRGLVSRDWEAVEDENVDKAGRIPRIPLALKERESRLVNVLGVLVHLEKKSDEVVTAAGSVPDAAIPTRDTTTTATLYNLAKTYED